MPWSSSISQEICTTQMPVGLDCWRGEIGTNYFCKSLNLWRLKISENIFQYNPKFSVSLHYYCFYLIVFWVKEYYIFCFITKIFIKNILASLSTIALFCARYLLLLSGAMQVRLETQEFSFCLRDINSLPAHNLPKIPLLIEYKAIQKFDIIFSSET